MAGRRARRPRCPRAQPQGRHRPAAAERADLHHRAVRLGEVAPRLRHDLRRGAAALRRVALRLRAPVPADDGEARRRLDRRALAGDLDRPEDDVAQPALDGRHGHGDLRLPAPALRARRPAALPGLRAADRRARALDQIVEQVLRAAGGHEVHGQRAGRARPQGRVPGPARGAAPRRLHAREGRRRAAAARGRDRPRQEVQAHDRGRRRPARDEGGSPAAARRSRSRRRPRWPRGSSRSTSSTARRCCSRRTSPAPSTASRCPSSSRASSPSTRRTAPARAARGSARSSRSTRTWSCPTPSLSLVGGALVPWSVGSSSFYECVVQAIADRYEIDARHAVARPDARAAGLLPLRHRRRADLRPVQEPDGPEAPVRDGVRRHRQQARSGATARPTRRSSASGSRST